MKLLFVDQYHLRPQEVERFRTLGFDEVVLASPDQSPAEVCDDPASIEVMVAREPYLTKYGHLLPGLRMMQMSLAGLDILPEGLLEPFPNLKLYSGSGCYGVSIAEWSIAKVLEIYKQRALFDGYREERKWSWEGSLNSQELFGKTAVVLGTGDIGSACAKRLKGFDCTVHGVNTGGGERPYFDACHPIEALAEVLPLGDVVIVTLPMTPKTRGLLDAPMMAHIKQGAVLVVNSRGGLIDERKLCEMLDSGQLYGAALDVFETEPLPADSPLWDQKNLLIQPHGSGVTSGLRDRYIEWFYENIKRYVDGEQPRSLVVPGRGY
ncbi:MAG: hypothetical protein GXX99_01780 [Clostridiales bacterium]|nr:hypothetical protein [Clostridiales bacterium]